jgi:gamma-glutamylcyclotransferase (GGCT)/AIG2-like uncharacterized protein YtfP
MPPLAGHLFTYGTLMQSFDNTYAKKLRKHTGYIGKGTFPGRLYRVEWYPGAVYEECASTLVFGEIYTIPELSVLKELDEYEDVLEDEKTSLYLRKIVPVTLEDGSLLDCWVYLYNQPTGHLPIISNGRFS